MKYITKNITMEQESLLLEFLEKAKIEELHNEFIVELIKVIKDDPSIIDYMLLT